MSSHSLGRRGNDVLATLPLSRSLSLPNPRPTYNSVFVTSVLGIDDCGPWCMMVSHIKR